MKSVNFCFKGLMCPVFTPFSADKKTINCDIIDKYACWLKQKGAKGVLVNGTTGEGTCLCVAERKRLAEEWMKACTKYEMMCMVQITGCCITDAYELAEHAEKIGVCAVLCLPELFFRPACEEDCVEYLMDIAKHCPTRPMYYYHIPYLTCVNMNMTRFCELAEQHIPTFCGLKCTCGDMWEGVACMKPGRNIIFAADTVMCGALALGFEAVSMTMMNICPEFSVDCWNAICNSKMREAQECQSKLMNRVCEITRNGCGDWVECMKTEFNKVNPGMSCGPLRKPAMKIHKKQC